jgi:hypothetical protein
VALIKTRLREVVRAAKGICLLPCRKSAKAHARRAEGGGREKSRTGKRKAREKRRAEKKKKAVIQLFS